MATRARAALRTLAASVRIPPYRGVTSQPRCDAFIPPIGGLMYWGSGGYRTVCQMLSWPARYPQIPLFHVRLSRSAPALLCSWSMKRHAGQQADSREDINERQNEEQSQPSPAKKPRQDVPPEPDVLELRARLLAKRVRQSISRVDPIRCSRLQRSASHLRSVSNGDSSMNEKTEQARRKNACVSCINTRSL